MKALLKLADNRRKNSLATKLRKKRFSLFKSLISALPKPLNILDVGGTTTFWEMMDFINEPNIKITILNKSVIDVHYPTICQHVGDARKMDEFKDNEFDVVFSNSVIEHVGDFEQQLQMANEIKRVGKTYYLQTPNYYFPIEPHFLFPFYQFIPRQIKLLLVQNLNLGWYQKIKDRQRAVDTIDSIKLLTKSKLITLFPDANLYHEKIFGLTKSFILIGRSQIQQGFDE